MIPSLATWELERKAGQEENPKVFGRRIAAIAATVQMTNILKSTTHGTKAQRRRHFLFFASQVVFWPLASRRRLASESSQLNRRERETFSPRFEAPGFGQRDRDFDFSSTLSCHCRAPEYPNPLTQACGAQSIRTSPQKTTEAQPSTGNLESSSFHSPQV